MLVHFSRGVIRQEDETMRAFWAEWDADLKMFVKGRGFVQPAEGYEVVTSELVTSFDLPGIGSEDVEFLIERLLEGGYLAKPGAVGKGDAILFMLVNEALHELDKLLDEESVD
jgi:hypothetical protein